jgi:hypothetical protein
MTQFRVRAEVAAAVIDERSLGIVTLLVTGGENPRINGASLLDRGFLMGWRGGYYTGRIGNACASEVVVRLR